MLRLQGFQFIVKYARTGLLLHLGDAVIPVVNCSTLKPGFSAREYSAVMLLRIRTVQNFLVCFKQVCIAAVYSALMSEV